MVPKRTAEGALVPPGRAGAGLGLDREPSRGDQSRNLAHTPPASAPRDELLVNGQRKGAG